MRAPELESQCDSIVKRLAQACRDGNVTDTDGPSFAPLREILADLSRTRALAGFSPTETAKFILSLKQPLFARLRAVLAADPDRLAAETLTGSELIDALGLFMMEAFQRASGGGDHPPADGNRGTFDTGGEAVAGRFGPSPDRHARFRPHSGGDGEFAGKYRSDAQADIAIIDITGVPTVDTLVAQHLLKTVAAARLMGADCIISGIRPQIAQTMVHLGVELNVISKANLSDAFALALRRVGKVVVNQRRAASTETV